MAAVNKVILVGNVGRDPEVRDVGGTRVASFRLATSEVYKDKRSGERREAVQWHSVQVWNDRLVPVIEAYVRKGTKLYLEGKLETRKWTDKAGVEKYVTEVALRYNAELQLLSGKGEEASGDTGSPDAPAKKIDLDDDLPF